MKTIYECLLTFRCRTILILSTLVVLLFFSSGIHADLSDNEAGGRIEVIQANGLKHFLPTVSTDYAVEIAGDIVTVKLTQQFRNDLDKSVNAEYLFPLNKDAAVHAMTMLVGNERIQAHIDRIEQATETFETAKTEGKSTTLLRQHRPNVFTQNIGNLAADAPITVELSYTQNITRIDHQYQLVLPLVVGPRYQSAGSYQTHTSTSQKVDSRQSFGGWELSGLPKQPPVIVATNNKTDADEPSSNGDVSISVRFNGDMVVSNIESDSHAIETTNTGDSTRSVSLALGQTPANRDFRLNYQLAGESVNTGVLAHHDNRGGFFSLLIEAPVVSAEETITAREMVFVLDCSGSMSGQPLNASKMFMRKALSALRPQDTFRIIRFSDDATEFSQTPLPASPENIARGIRYTNALKGGGGTEMTSGILQALMPPGKKGVVRMVSFLTDGYIGHEAEVLKLINTNLGDSRLIALGVGSAPNRYLLSEMAAMGRGFVRYVDPNADAEKVTTDLAERLQSPILTDIRIDWQGLAPRDVYPRRIPDLFAGQSIRVQGRYDKPGSYPLRVHGRIRGNEAELPVQAQLPKNGGDGPAVALNWARSSIAQGMQDLATAEVNGTDSNAIKEAVTELGLDFHLATRWTTFVAVSEKVYNEESADGDPLPVANHQVKGVSNSAYPQGQTFVGHGAPEAGTWLGLLVLLLHGFIYLARHFFGFGFGSRFVRWSFTHNTIYSNRVHLN